MSLWMEMKDYFNGKLQGEYIPRQQLLNEFGRSTALDVYVSHLVLCGYLKKVQDGLYYRSKVLSDDLTVCSLRKRLYGHDGNGPNREYAVRHRRRTRVRTRKA